jgi:hypothetical protein
MIGTPEGDVEMEDAEDAGGVGKATGSKEGSDGEGNVEKAETGKPKGKGKQKRKGKVKAKLAAMVVSSEDEDLMMIDGPGVGTGLEKGKGKADTIGDGEVKAVGSAVDDGDDDSGAEECLAPLRRLRCWTANVHEHCSRMPVSTYSNCPWTSSSARGTGVPPLKPRHENWQNQSLNRSSDHSRPTASFP